MWAREDIAWLAGLYEGEGCISLRGGNTYQLAIAMTDADVVARARRIASVGGIYARARQKPHYKDQTTWVVATEAETYALLVAMWPWLGERRQAKAAEAIQHFSTRPRRRLALHERQVVIDDWRATGDSQWALARRHGISRSRVQQLLSNEGTR